MTHPIVSADRDPPGHVAIIMDGNGRWAKTRGRPRIYGHRQGVAAVRRAVEAAPDLGIRYLTLFGFSSENWIRPSDEVEELMGLLRFYLRSEIAELHRNGVRLRVIGDRARLAADIRELIRHAEGLTAENRGLTLTLALNYGGRLEIAAAARSLARDVAAGRLQPDDIDEAAVAGRLFAADLPDPDLLIRTSGEQRISNFLLWQMAYAELMFVEVHWPDFSQAHLADAVAGYRQRDRRFGGTRAKRD